MCGIAGVRRFKDVPITDEEVKILLMALERRGNHATGIAIMDKDEIFVHKAPVPAWSFCATPETQTFLDEHLTTATMVLLHTRFATIGNPIANENNHPMFLNKSAVVHNGGISNYDSQFRELKLARSCETDSDIFRAILDDKGFTPEAITCMNKLSGSAAIAAFTQEAPDQLLLARSGSPLTYGVTPEKLWWASELKAIQLAVRPWVKEHGLYARKSRSDVAYYAMPDDTAYFLGEEGLTKRLPFKTCSYYRAPNYQARATYHQRMTEFERSARVSRKYDPVKALPSGSASKATPTVKGALCPNPKCKIQCNIPYKDSFVSYKCPKCSHSLSSCQSLPASSLILFSDNNS